MQLLDANSKFVAGLNMGLRKMLLFYGFLHSSGHSDKVNCQYFA